MSRTLTFRTSTLRLSRQKHSLFSPLRRERIAVRKGSACCPRRSFSNEERGTLELFRRGGDRRLCDENVESNVILVIRMLVVVLIVSILVFLREEPRNFVIAFGLGFF